MKKLHCVPILKLLNHEEKLTVIYFGAHFNKYLLLSKSKFNIKMIVLKTESNIWKLEFIQNIKNCSNKAINGEKVVSMGDLIILLDEEGNLWKLVNYCEKSEKEEFLRSLDEFSFYLWVPFKKFKFVNVKDIKVIKNNLFCLGITSDSKIKFQVIDSENILLSSKTILENFSDMDYLNFCMEIIKVNLQALNFNYVFGFEEEINGTILLSDRKVVCLYKNCIQYFVDCNKSKVINTIDLINENCLLLGFSCGKLIFIFYKNMGEVSTNAMVVSKHLISIEKCKFCESCVIWSNGVYLYHMKFKFDFSKTCPVKFTCFKIGEKFQNVGSVFGAGKCMLVNTHNNNFYQIVEEDSIKSRVTKTNLYTDKFLLEIGAKSMEVGLLVEKKKTELNFFENLEMIQNCNLKEFLKLKHKNNCITLKSNLERVLSKIYWKIILKGMCKGRNSVEILNLESDLSPGEIVKFDSELLLKGEVLVSLIGNFGVEFNLLFVNLGKIEKGVKTLGKLEGRKCLQEKVTTKNIYRKVHKAF